MNWLALIWCGIIAFGVIMYVILGGFDLGIGIMSIFFKEEKERDLLMSAILPVWDGNQTWLVFGGATLYGAFPAAFSAILPLMYIPLLIMVIALLFRGVSFEFRLKAIRTKRFWEFCIFLGSVSATMAQGFILGTFVQGFNLSATAGSIEQWFNPFGLACAIALVFGYVLLGSNFLIIKTVGALQEKSYTLSGKIQYIILAACIMVSVWSPFLDPSIRQRWFNPDYIGYLAILPFLTMIFLITHGVAIRKKYEYLPFWSAIGMFLMCYFGFIISSYPYIVPRQITYTEAAADKSSLLFMLVGVCMMLPPLLYYTYYSYRIFRGKVTQLGY
ncbi:MAG: cydB [Gammaproteobacteria bacterium]|jgi:cytochrome d ubiquinol oxidase subunit II|nr:cydB [Gammaproteobacteria bacterium]